MLRRHDPCEGQKRSGQPRFRGPDIPKTSVSFVIGAILIIALGAVPGVAKTQLQRHRIVLRAWRYFPSGHGSLVQKGRCRRTKCARLETPPGPAFQLQGETM